MLAVALGFSPSQATVIATVVSELARNIAVHAGCGEIVIERVQQCDLRMPGGRTGIRITACDNGPGISDVELALVEGFSTTGGMGLGLAAARRAMDGFNIESAPGGGTTVVVVKWRES